jgi:hypothetical protein
MQTKKAAELVNGDRLQHDKGIATVRKVTPFADSVLLEFAIGKDPVTKRVVMKKTAPVSVKEKDEK